MARSQRHFYPTLPPPKIFCIFGTLRDLRITFGFFTEIMIHHEQVLGPKDPKNLCPPFCWPGLCCMLWIRSPVIIIPQLRPDLLDHKTKANHSLALNGSSVIVIELCVCLLKERERLKTAVFGGFGFIPRPEHT